MQTGQWLRLAAVVTWLICGLLPALEILERPALSSPVVLWIAAFIAYGAALAVVMYAADKVPAHPVRVGLVAVQSLTGLAMIYLTATYFSGSGVSPATLVVVAAELPYVVAPAWAWTWVGVQGALLPLLFVGQATRAELLSIGIALGGFQLFAVASSLLARSEAAARQQLAEAHVELLATRAMLAENSRVAERLRISRDLHDTLGHHLTALSLQLDVAARLADGKAAEHIRQAHAIARLLLSDVRDVVSRLRDTGRVDLVHAVRALVADQSGITIHLDLPPALAMDDPARAETVLRCVQEIITNTTRHAQARNLWIRIEARPDGIGLHARDDGRGAGAVSCGHGLTGMRERFEQYAGHVEFDPGAGTGFQVHGFLPTAADA